MDYKIRNTIINYLRSEYTNLGTSTTKSYPNCIFCTHKGRVIFDYNKNYNCSFVSLEITSFIDLYFNVSEQEKHSIIRVWIDIVTGISPGSIIEDDLVSKLRWMEI
jgi:hypothetical protein